MTPPSKPSVTTSEEDRLPHQAQELAAEALMLAQEAKDIAKRLVYIKSKLASMTMTVKTMDPVTTETPPSSSDAAAAAVIPPVETMDSMTPFEDDKAQVIAAAAVATIPPQGSASCKSSAEKVPSISSSSATAPVQGAKNAATDQPAPTTPAAGLVEKEAAVDADADAVMADDGISTLTSASSDQTSSTAVSPTTTTLEEKTKRTTSLPVVAAEEEEQVVPQEPQSANPDIEITDDVVDNVMASRSMVEPDEKAVVVSSSVLEEESATTEVVEAKMIEKTAEASAMVEQPVDEKTAPRDPSVAEEVSGKAPHEPEVGSADENIETNSIAQEEDTAAVECKEATPPKAVPTTEEYQEIVSRRIVAAKKGAFESLLDGVGVGRLCGVDNVALGLSSSTSTAEEEPFVNPTKLTLSSEKDMLMDVFGPDHDAFVSCGKISDLCDVQLDQTLSNDLIQDLPDDATVAASVLKSLDKHVFGFM